MKKIFPILVLVFLSLAGSAHAETKYECLSTPPFYRLIFSWNEKDILPKAQLFNRVDDKNWRAEKNPVTCYPKTDLVNKALCGVQYGPDGGQDLFFDRSKPGIITVSMTPMGPTGPGTSETLVCRPL